VATTGPNVRPGEKPPKLPDLAKTNTPVGAVTFAQYWFQALDWGYATTDSTLVHSLYSDSCSECARFAGIFDSTRAAGGHFRGGRIATSSANLVDDKSHADSMVVDVTFAQTKVQRVDSHGRASSAESADDHVIYRVWIRWLPSWFVIDLKQVVHR
jgi:hypothetical protein